jgi:hypothetical protein
MQGKKKLTSFSNAEETAVKGYGVLFHFLLEMLSEMDFCLIEVESISAQVQDGLLDKVKSLT